MLSSPYPLARDPPDLIRPALLAGADPSAGSYGRDLRAAAAS